MGVKLDQIRGLLQRAAAAGAKHPRITWTTAHGNLVRLKMATTGQWAGVVFVCGHEGERFGMITSAAEFRPCRGHEDADLVRQLLEAIERHGPERYFAERGADALQCVFCGRGLDTDASKSAGYGPICADKYGLPWG